MNTLKIISFVKLYPLVIFLGTSIVNINSSLDKRVEFSTFTGEIDNSFILNKTTRAHFGHLKLEISSNESAYSTDFYFNSNATSGLDSGYDSAVFEGNLPDLAIYSYLVQNSNDTTFAIQALSNLDMQNVTIPLGVNANQGEEVTISISETDMSDSIDVYLEDTLNNEVVLLNDNDYILTPNNNISGQGRFFLRFQGDALNTVEPVLKNLHIAFNNNTQEIVINGQLNNETKINLYDLNGKALISKHLKLSSIIQSLDVSHLNINIYILELVSNTNVKRIQKIIIY